MIDCASLTDEIEQTDQLMRERKELFHRMWEEEQQRITIEQTIFKEQVKVAQINYVSRNQLHCTANLNFGLMSRSICSLILLFFYLLSFVVGTDF